MCLLPHCGLGEDIEKPEPHPEGPESSSQVSLTLQEQWDKWPQKRCDGEGSPPAPFGT